MHQILLTAMASMDASSNSSGWAICCPETCSSVKAVQADKPLMTDKAHPSKNLQIELLRSLFWQACLFTANVQLLQLGGFVKRSQACDRVVLQVQVR